MPEGGARPAGQPRPGGRAATASFAAVALASLWVLFAPSQGGPQLFDGADKLVHLALFAALAATARWRSGPRVLVLLAVAAYAPASELVQAGLLPDRSGGPYDVVADLLGAALGWLAARRVLAGAEQVSAGR